MAESAPDIICIGAVLWDVIGRSPVPMQYGADVPGRITRLPGGVAMNIAMAVRRFGLTPTLLTAIGEDAAGTELIGACAELGVRADHVYRANFPTDRYMAIEDSNDLVAAIADAHSLEAAGAKILEPLRDGRLGNADGPWVDLIALDGNLTEDLLGDIARCPCFAKADLRMAPASPGKVERLRPLLGHAGATLYLNRHEANLLCHEPFPDSESAAKALLARGARRVLVTDGPRSCTDACADGGVFTDVPPKVQVNRCTGAGDVFMAAHIVAERSGKSRAEALSFAVEAAAAHVAGDTGL